MGTHEDKYKNALGYVLEVIANHGNVKAALEEVYDEYGWEIASEVGDEVGEEI